MILKKIDKKLEQSKEKLIEMEQNVRKNELKLYPFDNWINNKYVNTQEKEMILEAIINDIKEWRTSLFELEQENKILGSFCIIHCTSCKKWFDDECINNINNNIVDPISFNIFMKKYEKLNYTCGPNCKFIKNNMNKEVKDIYIQNINNRRTKLESVEKLRIGYRVALEQQKNLTKQYSVLINTFKELNSILVFKKKKLQYIINWIQISVIMVSSIITFFESVKHTFEKSINEFFLATFPIICSSYIGLILAIARFFKLDSSNEQVLKLIEKYSFIVNKLRQKRTKYISFDFKIHNLEEWTNLLNIVEKDSIDDIITKANEEFDLIMPLKEFVKYKKKYTKTRLRELTERSNFKELVNIVQASNNLSTDQKTLSQAIIKKRNWYKYYFCFMWCCVERDYVDYNEVLVTNRTHFKEYFDNSARFRKENELYLKQINKLELQIDEDERILTEQDNTVFKLLKVFHNCSSENNDVIEKYSSDHQMTDKKNIEITIIQPSSKIDTNLEDVVV
tara:strand:- start:4059 stop:5582 length:1524 start_codon:yes stop_codon:yes gene_type:complete